MKALVLLNGEPPSKELLDEQLAGAELVVCADGAACWAYPDIKIDVLIGDMDSIGDRLKDAARSIRKIVTLQCEKDETDAQAAIQVCLEAGADEIVLLGALGKRFDHALGNLQLLRMIEQKGVDARIEDGGMTVFALLGRKELSGWPGRLISLIPLGESIHVCTSGLKYPLCDEWLDPALPRGVSNEFLGEEATVVVTGGYCALTLLRRT